VQLGIKPLILHYHESARRLSVVDRGFLIWISYQDSDELLELVGLPAERRDPQLFDDAARPVSDLIT
jgi:hypothetical protein